MKSVQSIINIAREFNGYDNSQKALFHKSAKAYLKELAKALFAEGTYDIRSNKAGIACLGEVTLHSDSLYVVFGGSVPGTAFMYRTCNGRKDYTGDKNCWMQYDRLSNFYGVVSTFSAAIRCKAYQLMDD